MKGVWLSAHAACTSARNRGLDAACHVGNAKHRLFVWMQTDIIPDHRLHVIARRMIISWVLQSTAHTSWSFEWAQLRGRPSYNSDTIFLTFPFPAAGTNPAKKPIPRKSHRRRRPLARPLRDACSTRQTSTRATFQAHLTNSTTSVPSGSPTLTAPRRGSLRRLRLPSNSPRRILAASSPSTRARRRQKI